MALDQGMSVAPPRKSRRSAPSLWTRGAAERSRAQAAEEGGRRSGGGRGARRSHVGAHGSTSLTL